MTTQKSLRSEGRHRRAGALLLLCLATACGDQKATGDTTGGAAGAPAGGTNGDAGGRPAIAGATSGGASGVSGAAASGGRAGAAGASARGGTGSAGQPAVAGASARGGSGGSAAGSGGAAGGSTNAGANQGGANQGGASHGGSNQGGANQGGAPGATLAEVQTIFDAHCVNCHDASKGGLPTYPMLPLTAGASHDALVNVPADETCGGVRVVPGNPDASYLVQKLEQTQPCDGQHMPRAFEVIMPVPLTSDELSKIRGWIQAGAPK